MTVKTLITTPGPHTKIHFLNFQSSIKIDGGCVNLNNQK